MNACLSSEWMRGGWSGHRPEFHFCTRVRPPEESPNVFDRLQYYIAETLDLLLLSKIRVFLCHAGSSV